MNEDSFVYILKCKDNTYYTGWTNDIDKRLKAHNKGVASKYTRGRIPVKLVYLERLDNKSEGLRREASIKKITRSENEELIRNYQHSK